MLSLNRTRISGRHSVSLPGIQPSKRITRIRSAFLLEHPVPIPLLHPQRRPWPRPPHSIRGDSTDCLSFACHWSRSNSNSILAPMTKPATTLAPTGIFAFFVKRIQVGRGSWRWRWRWAWFQDRHIVSYQQRKEPSEISSCQPGCR